MKSVVIVLFWFTYFHGDASKASATKMLQIDGLKNENILDNRGSESIFYKFTNNEVLILTCRRNQRPTYGTIRLSWYKSGVRVSSTIKDKLEQKFILNEFDADLTLECQLNKETSQNFNEDNLQYQERKEIKLKYEKYIPSSAEPETEISPRLEITLKEKNIVCGIITLIVIIIAFLLIFIMLKIYKSKEKKRIRTAKPTLNMRYSTSRDAHFEDPNFEELNVYSIPYSEAGKVYSVPIQPIETNKTLNTTGYNKFTKNNYHEYENKYQNQYNYVNQNISLPKDAANICDVNINNFKSNLYSI
ncbi:unnamed protein product, partial [Brenthis ino]